jgi:hypothetical protein
VPKVAEQLKGGANIVYNRLDTRVMTVPKGGTIFRWLNVLNGDSLPNRIYLGFVGQDSFYGKMNQSSTYFERLNVTSVNFKLLGRDLLVEPIRVKWATNDAGEIDAANSDGMNGYLSIVEVLDLPRDDSGAIKLDYVAYRDGITFYAVELGKVGEQSGTSGNLDLEVTFGEGGAEMEACAILFTERTQTAQIRPS